MNSVPGEKLGYCGLNCLTCPIYETTRIEDKEEQERRRTEIVRMCREEYGIMYDLKYITDCDGCCTNNEILFSACRTCKIRNCARERGYENCAFCTEYPCSILEQYYIKDPSAKANLDRIRLRM